MTFDDDNNGKDKKRKCSKNLSYRMLCTAVLSILSFLFIAGYASFVSTTQPTAPFGLRSGTVGILGWGADPVLKPNATAMQWHNDVRKSDDPAAYKFPSHHSLGSPCEGTPIEIPSTEIETLQEKCSKLRFPLSKTQSEGGGQKAVPEECWPRLALIASYPTSGSSMARMLFSLSTGLATGKKGQQIIFDWGEWSALGTDAPSFCDSNLQLPYAGRVALVKTSRSPERHNILIKDGVLKNPKKATLPSHIIRLVRNPGDHMLREASRMYSESKTNYDAEEFEEHAKLVCAEVFNKQVGKFLFFHRRWEEVSHHIPSIMLHYEEMTDPDVVGARMGEIVNFVGETQSFEVNYSEVVRRPTYKQGALFKEVCGLDMARQLHLLTEEVSDLIGYTFDCEEGIWSMRNETSPRVKNRVAKNIAACHVKPTIGSPCAKFLGKGTTGRALKSYDNDDNDECSNLALPLDFTSAAGKKIPSKCRPRLVLFPSFRSSGDGVAQSLFRHATNLETFVMKQSGNLIYDWGGNSGGEFQIRTNMVEVCENGLQLPYNGKPVLLKTGWKAFQAFPDLFDEWNQPLLDEDVNLSNSIDPELRSNIIRLVRNPGDNLIRNAVTWDTTDNANLGKVEKVCKEVKNNAVVWAKFHASWEHVSNYIPSTILRFEDLTNRDRVGEKLDGAIEFIGAEKAMDGDYADHLQKPTYVHGTLMRKMCGIETARTVHKLTVNVTKTMGYKFNYEAGSWYVSDDGIENIPTQEQEAEPIPFPSDVKIGSPCAHLAGKKTGRKLAKSDDDDEEEDEDECSALILPLDLTSTSPNEIPSKCRPRLILFPSFRFSGDGVTQQLFRHATKRETFVMKQSGNLIYDWGGGSEFKIRTNMAEVCENGYELPYNGKPVLLKTGWKAFQAFPYLFDESNQALLDEDVDLSNFNSTDPELPSNIVRLVRNPGDNLIRNAVHWWESSNHDGKGDSSFLGKMEAICRQVKNNAVVWAKFHASWEHASNYIPSTILRFEDLTDLERVGKELDGAIEFIGAEKANNDGNYADHLQKPTYVHGTLMEEICGIETARTVHELTVHVTKTMGYEFDYEAGKWNV